MGESLPEQLAREARLRNDGFIDCCHPQYCEALAPHPPCPTCQAIERVAVLAVRAALDEVAAAIEGCDREVNRLADKIRALKGEVPPAP